MSLEQILHATLKNADGDGAQNFQVFPNIYFHLEFPKEITDWRIREWTSTFNNNATMTQRQAIWETAAFILRNAHTFNIKGYKEILGGEKKKQTSPVGGSAEQQDMGTGGETRKQGGRGPLCDSEATEHGDPESHRQPEPLFFL